MALSFEPFIAAVKAELLTVWPEVATGGVWDSENISRVPWSDLGLPYAVILIPDWPRTSEWGMANLTFQPVLSIFYVSATLGKAVTLRGKLVALVNALYPNDPLKTAGVGQVVEIGDLSVGDDLPPNQLFVSANRAQRAGMVRVTCLVGITNP